MPSKHQGSGFGMESGWSQDKQRVIKIFWDQHRNERLGFPNGRPWWSHCEKQVNGTDAMPVGELMPVNGDMILLPDGKLEIARRAGVAAGYADGEQLPSGALFIKGWSAPWTPEPQYVVAAMAAMRGNRIRWDYAKMQKDRVDANVRYYSKANEEAASRSWPGVKLYGAVSFQLRSVKGIGAPPKSPKIPEAALAGDSWLLGFSEEVNEVLAHVLATENGLGIEHEYNIPADEPKATPSLSEFALGLTMEELQAVREMVAQKRTRETKKAGKPAEAA